MHYVLFCETIFCVPHILCTFIIYRYGPTFLLGTIFMMGGAIAALHNERREFFFTAIGNGIQNGVSSMYSANLLRSKSPSVFMILICTICSQTNNSVHTQYGIVVLFYQKRVI